MTKLLNLGLLFFTQIAGLLNAAEWTLKSDTEGIKVYSRQEDGSPIVSFRGETELAYSALEIARVLARADLYKEWMPLVYESAILKEYSKTHKDVFLAVDLPWPVKDRYFVNQGQMHYEGEVMVLNIRSIEYPLPEEKRVQGWTKHSKMVLRPTPQGSHMEVEFHQDPRGSVPAFMVNWVQASWPRDFFRNLSKFMGSRKEGAKP